MNSKFEPSRSPSTSESGIGCTTNKSPPLESLRRRTAFAGLIVRRESWSLSFRGWLLSTSILATVLGFGFFDLYPFLAITDRVPSRVLVVDGWMPTQLLYRAADEFVGGHYQTALVVRGVYPDDSRDLERPRDDYVADILVRHGIPRERLHSVLFPGYIKNRTYHSALALKDWGEKNKIRLDSFDIVTVGSHARRSRLLFERVFRQTARIGVIGMEDPTFDPKHWWQSSEGVREVLFEGVAYVYVLLMSTPTS
jgi:hypothetical protein